MAVNRFSNLTAPRFDARSLEEILMVPLAKQKKQDELLAGTAAVSALDSKRLDADEELVSGDLEGLRSRSADLSKDILERGFDRSSRNQFNQLKLDAEQAFAVSGNIGQAKAAYDKRQANITAVMSNKGLSSQQQAAGLASSLRDYTGISNNGTYQDYVGADQVDIPALALDVASEMKPQELADALPGYSYNETTGLYSNGRYETKTLPADVIAQATLQYLMNDEGVASYMKDMQQIGLISNPQDYLKNAALNAGNLKQVNDEKITRTNLPQWAQERLLSGSKRIDTSNIDGWESYHIAEYGLEVEDKYNIDPNDESLYDSEGNILSTESLEQEILKLGKINTVGTSVGIRGAAYGVGNASRLNAIALNEKKKQLEQIKSFKTFRENNPEIGNLSDRDAARIYSSSLKSAGANYSQVLQPLNRENSMVYLNDIVLGSKTSGASIKSKPIHIAGESGTTTFSVLAKNLGMREDDLVKYMRTGGGDDGTGTGSLLGIMPNSELPMGITFQFPDPKDLDKQITITVGNSDAVKNKLYQSSKLTQNQLSGRDFEIEQFIARDNGEPAYRYYVNELIPEIDNEGNLTGEGKYESYIVESGQKFENKGDLLKADEGSDDFRKTSQADIATRDQHALEAYYNRVVQKK